MGLRYTRNKSEAAQEKGQQVLMKEREMEDELRRVGDTEKRKTRREEEI